MSELPIVTLVRVSVSGDCATASKRLQWWLKSIKIGVFGNHENLRDLAAEQRDLRSK